MERIREKSLICLWVFLIHLVVSVASVEAARPMWFQRIMEVKFGSSTRKDVEQLFGNPRESTMITGKYTIDVTYNVDFGRLTINYSAGSCPGEPGIGFNVEKDRAVGISVQLRRRVKISRLGLLMSNFERYQSIDNDGVKFYNDSMGIRLFGSDTHASFIDVDVGDDLAYLLCKRDSNVDLLTVSFRFCWTSDSGLRGWLQRVNLE